MANFTEKLFDILAGNNRQTGQDEVETTTPWSAVQTEIGVATLIKVSCPKFRRATSFSSCESSQLPLVGRMGEYSPIMELE